MTTSSYSSLASVSPSIAGFATQLVQDLTQGRSTIVLLPQTVPLIEIEDLIDRHLWQRSLDVRKLFIEDLQQHDSILSMMESTLGVKWSETETRTVQNLLTKNLEFDILFMFGFEAASSELRTSLRILAEGWAEAAKSQLDSGKHFPSLCIVAKASSLLPYLPKEDVNLSIYWWWGIPSMLEMQLFARTLMDIADEDPKLRWRESVLPHIASTDLTLFSVLWDHTSDTSEALLALLCDYAAEQGWSDDTDSLNAPSASQELIKPFQHSFMQGPPVKLRETWAKGMLLQTTEFGIEIHSAVLAISGHKDSVMHRIWRGQAALLLPQLDYIRLKICTHFTALYGSKWPTWIEPTSPQELEAIKQNPLSCQWGHLKRLIDECDRLAFHAPLVPLVRHARKLRNTLAHYGIVTFSDYQLLSSDVSKMKLTISG
jgi:hypothetical protein